MQENQIGLVQIKNGYDLSRLYKYWIHQVKQNLRPIIFNRINCKTFYNHHRKQFDNAYNFFTKCKIDLVKYIKYFVVSERKFENDLDKYILDLNLINRFHTELLIHRQYEKIYKYFEKSAKNIVDDCIKYDFYSVKDYLQYLIQHKKLVNEFVSGRISAYYLCAIQNFKQLVEKMDLMSQQEFNKLLVRYDKYNNDIQDAFMYLKSQRVQPIKYTEKLLEDKLKTNKLI